jgi:hypothetical protein
MPAVRTEVKHPKLVSEALEAACAHAMQQYGVSGQAARRALARHYTEALASQLAHTQDELSCALVRLAVLTEQQASQQAELEDLRDVARVGYEPPPSGEVADLQEQLALATVALHLQLQSEPLYAVQQVTTLSQAANALEDGQWLGVLAQQVVLVRPVHVYDGAGAVLNHAEVTQGGAAVCTAAGLEQAGLPVPGAGA